MRMHLQVAYIHVHSIEVGAGDDETSDDVLERIGADNLPPAIDVTLDWTMLVPSGDQS